MEVLREEEASVGSGFDPHTKCKPGGRLDMNHGFLHHIRRNQIARDDYDKEVKQAKEKQKRRHSNTPSRPRRPDIQVYHPRRRSASEQNAGPENEESNDSSSSTEPEHQGTELFCLEYEADSGQITSFVVYKEDKPDRVVEKVAAANALDAAMRAALRARVQEEMDKRRDKR